MAIPASELRRGRICLAVFPFAPAFPLVLAGGTHVPSIERWARMHQGQTVEVIAEARLRPVLLLHDRTRAEHEDVVCLRINTVKAAHRRRASAWQRIVQHEHPFFVHLPKAIGRYRLHEDSVIAITSIGAVHRSAILSATGGELSPQEMQRIGEKLVRALDLDLAPWIAARAHELLRRAGVELPPTS